MRATFVCNVCGNPISSGEGRLEFMNGNPELGVVGSYPKESHDRWVQLSPAEQMAELGISRNPGPIIPDAYSGQEMAALMLASMDRPRNIRIAVHHSRCDPNLDSTTYYLPLREIETFDGLMHWIDHLHEKKWFGREELYDLLHLWQRAATRNPEEL